MILVTGGTGFIGQSLIRQLVTLGKPVRILLKPSPVSPNLPRGVSVEAAVSSFRDERSLRAALKGIDVIFHLAGSERLSSRADLTSTDVEGTQLLVRAAVDAGVERIFFVSHLGADRASAFAVLKAKALAEGFIVNSGLKYTIFRSAVIYGPGDQFTTSLAKLLQLAPGFILLPGDGSTLIQPLWIEDFVACMILSLEENIARNEILSLGGGEYLSFNQIVAITQAALEIRRKVVYLPPPYLRTLALIMEQVMPKFPVSVFWLDYLATDRTTALDTLPRVFGVIPARFHQQLGYLKAKPRSIFRSQKR